MRTVCRLSLPMFDGTMCEASQLSGHSSISGVATFVPPNIHCSSASPLRITGLRSCSADIKLFIVEIMLVLVSRYG